MRLTRRTYVAVVVAVSMSTGGTWSFVGNLQAVSGPKTTVAPENGLGAAPRGAVTVRMTASAVSQDERDRLRNERVKVAERLAALEEVRKPTSDLARRMSARLKRMLAILEIPDLPSSARARRFEQLGISRFYRGADLVVKGSDFERTVKALGRPVHPASFLQSRHVPDGSAPGEAQQEWEQEWEDTQIDAEDTIVAIEALASEAEGVASELEGMGGLAQTEGWISDIEGIGSPESEGASWAGDLDGDEAAMAGCPATGSSDADSEWDCLSAVGTALAETLGAIAAYLGNSEAVKGALTNARNAIGVAMGAFTAGTLTAGGLASAAVSAITALAGSTTAGWVAAAAIGVISAVVVYEIYQNCIAYEPESLDAARGYMG